MGFWRGSSFLGMQCQASDAMQSNSMSIELKTDLDLEIRSKAPARRVADPDIRLNPVPAKNTLLAIVFFSAVAAAILYWIFFPPSTPQSSARSPTASAQTAEQH
jgi:hypothetical protein